MLPYQAMAMDYASASFQRHPATNVGHHHHAAGGGPGGGGPAAAAAAAAAFSPSWFVPADLCMPFAKQNQPLVEPGLVLQKNYLFFFLDLNVQDDTQDYELHYTLLDSEQIYF